jgi:hypothetical protein
MKLKKFFLVIRLCVFGKKVKPLAKIYIWLMAKQMPDATW